MIQKQEALARAISYIDDDMILAAHKGHKRLRRLPLPLAAACLAVVLLATFPYLREVINTDLVLAPPADQGEAVRPEDAPEAGRPIAPQPSQINGIGRPHTLGTDQITLTAVTETTVTLTLQKTSTTPLYIAVYDLLGDPLATTEPDFKVNGALIRPHVLALYIDQATEPVYALPESPGVYEIVVDFAAVRHGTYPMQAHIGLYTYPAGADTPKTVYFSLDIPTEDSTSDGTSDGHERPICD